MTGQKQDIEPGEEAEYTLDLTGVNGKGFLLQIMGLCQKHHHL